MAKGEQQEIKQPQQVNLNVDTLDGAVNFLRGFIQSPEIRGFSGRDFTLANVAVTTLGNNLDNIETVEELKKELTALKKKLPEVKK